MKPRTIQLLSMPAEKILQEFSNFGEELQAGLYEAKVPLITGETLETALLRGFMAGYSEAKSKPPVMVRVRVIDTKGIPRDETFSLPPQVDEKDREAVENEIKSQITAYNTYQVDDQFKIEFKEVMDIIKG